MQIREATESDSNRIREIAEQSLQASYSLSPRDIETILEYEFGPESLTDVIGEDRQILLVAEEEGTVLGFVETRITEGERGEIVWLHVDPTERGKGAGTELFERALARLRERVAEKIQAIVLADNQEGGGFFEQFDFKHSGRTEREIGDKTIHAEIHIDVEEEQAEEGYTVPAAEEIAVDGEPRFLDPDESISGKESEFLLVFEEESREERFGFYCTNCGSFTDSVDGQGKVICENCGNTHNPEEWDESYL